MVGTMGCTYIVLFVVEELLSFNSLEGLVCGSINSAANALAVEIMVVEGVVGMLAR